MTCSAEPFLFRHATTRTSEGDMPGRYSALADLWVVDTEEGERPIIDVDGGAMVATATKTMTQQESDDDDPGRSALAETSTFTKVRQESADDDADPGLVGPAAATGARFTGRTLAETSTYTRVRQESADEDASWCLPELATKTFVQQESDDEVEAPI